MYVLRSKKVLNIQKCFRYALTRTPATELTTCIRVIHEVDLQKHGLGIKIKLTKIMTFLTN